MKTKRKCLKGKRQMIKVDLDAALKVQEKYDKLVADCKDLANVIVNLMQGKEEPTMIEFNDHDGYPEMCLDIIRHHATWSKSPKVSK